MREFATLIRHRKLDLDDGTIIEIKIWRLPFSTIERPHGLKYSLFFGRKGERIIGYDNEAGKRDHRHYRTRQEKYQFISLKQLIFDFELDVKKETGHG
jgi:Family of unknown function (DUF6516)